MAEDPPLAAAAWENVCSQGHCGLWELQEWDKQLFCIEPPRTQPVWPITNLMLELASAWVVRSEDTKMYLIQIPPTLACHVAGWP